MAEPTATATPATTTTGDSTQDYVLAGGKNGATDSPNDLNVVELAQEKLGHKCCGGCCDMRRATMIVNMVNIGLIVLGLWYLASYASSATSNSGYDEVYSEGGELQGMGIIAAIMVVRMLANAAGIYGAYTFNIYLVGVSLAAYALETIFALLGFNLAGILMAIGFAYPHVFFIKEVRAGIMTKERYHPGIEEQSCCCV